LLIVLAGGTLPLVSSFTSLDAPATQAVGAVAQTLGTPTAQSAYSAARFGRA
jgi:hypothetical protein